MEMITVSRTIGQGRVIDELIARFTHSIRMDWILPGYSFTGRSCQVVAGSIVQLHENRAANP